MTVYAVAEVISEYPGSAIIYCCGTGQYIECIPEGAGSHTHSDTAYEALNDLLTMTSEPNNKVKQDIGDCGYRQGKILQGPPLPPLVCQS